MLTSLEAGSSARGTVVSVADYGAVVDLGGVRGLVHRSELSWHRFDEITDVVNVGQEVEVEVLDVNRSKRRISLSLRRTEPDPLDSVAIGQISSATVIRVVEYGAFARLDDCGAEGLVHMSELSDVPGFRPDQLVTPGEQMMVKVLEIDQSDAASPCRSVAVLRRRRLTSADPQPGGRGASVRVGPAASPAQNERGGATNRTATVG